MPFTSFTDIIPLLNFLPDPNSPGGLAHSQAQQEYIAQTIFSIYTASGQNAATVTLRSAIEALTPLNSK